MPTIFPNTSNQNFEITILFNVNERSRNYTFEDDTPPQNPQGRSCTLCPGAKQGLYRKGDYINFGFRLIGLVIKTSCALVKIQSDKRADIPTPHTHIHLVFSRTAFGRNFKMAICCLGNFEKSSFD